MIVDLFAGPGGWSQGLWMLNRRRALGIEIDRDAVATRRAAGHMALRADVTALDPARFGNVEGLIASPPCTAFSNAGKRKGKRWLGVLVHAIRREQWDLPVLRRLDPTIWLPLEVGRWAEACRPPWVALEQVPPAMRLWAAYREVFERWGYSVWCGVLNAADYGVPQTRKRAVLIAHITRLVVQAPSPTHAKDGAGGLTGWVSMAEALGWGLVERQAHGSRRTLDQPAMTITGSADNGNFRWTFSRPATTIAGDPRVSAPGWRGAPRDYDADGNYIGERSMDRAIKLSIDQALVLQSFPEDYPVVGNKTSQFRQVGNAVPPLLARAVLGQVAP